MKTTTIEVSHETWRQLSFRKEPGESFDDVISSFMDTEIHEFEDDEPEVVDWMEADEGQQCGAFTPDRGECDHEADYILTMEYKGSRNAVAYCEGHANLPEEDLQG